MYTCCKEINETCIKYGVLKHIFEPFYITKEFGKGACIGLAIAHGIIKKSDGKIEVHSDGKSGTTFNLVWKCKWIYRNIRRK